MNALRERILILIFWNLFRMGMQIISNWRKKFLFALFSNLILYKCRCKSNSELLRFFLRSLSAIYFTNFHIIEKKNERLKK